MLSDLRFVRKIVSDKLVDIEVNVDGSLAADACHLDRIECRMPPSKSDPIQRAGNELIFPCKMEPDDIDGAMENIAHFMNKYPVDLELHRLTPLLLLRDKREGVQRQIRRHEFIRDFKMVCRTASMRYERWGTHAFRVDGMHAMQDAGASVPEIMALGHWRSDTWLLYSRRNRPRLQAWAKQILHERQPGDIRNKQAFRRLVSAGVGKDGRYHHQWP
jgi:hypothetical protein